MNSNNIEYVKEITHNRFKIYVMHSKSPFLEFIGKEMNYYSNYNYTILGTIIFDYTDKDFSCVLLCRDEINKFKAFETGIGFRKINHAKRWIIRKIKDYTRNEIKIVEQGDKQKGVDLFNNVINPNNLHPYFELLKNNSGKLPAKNTIIEVANHFGDIDGNFVEQFQSINGFDSRLWELYLFAFFTEENFLFDRTHHRPDFIILKNQISIGVEAVIVARPQDKPPTIIPSEIESKTLDQINNEISNDMPLRFGSTLYSKLKMKYWEDEHLKDKPIIFAIADFHADQSMLWSYTALVNYLYGLNYEHSFDENNNLIITPKKINPYIKKNGEEIDAGFFNISDANNVSAILFSSTATISKFTRIGIQSGLGQINHHVVRFGAKVNHDPNSLMPEPFSYIVNENCNETWGEGVNLFHNPNALHPIDPSLFPNIAHHYLKNGLIHSITPDFHPFFSINQIIIPEGE